MKSILFCLMDHLICERRIFGFLRKLLLERHGNAIGFSVLEDLRVFLESITSPSSFAASAKDLSDSIESLVNMPNMHYRIYSELSQIRRRKQVRLRSSTIASLGTRSIRQSEIEPDRLAFAMMLVEGNSYKRITPTDCVLYLMDQDMPTSISDARVLNNKIVNWIKRAILRSDRINDRGDTLRFFINTALVSLLPSICVKIGICGLIIHYLGVPKASQLFVHVRDTGSDQFICYRRTEENKRLP